MVILITLARYSRLVLNTSGHSVGGSQKQASAGGRLTWNTIDFIKKLDILGTVLGTNLTFGHHMALKR